MESKAKLVGQAIHPMLIVFPLGLLATAVICDLIYLVTGFAELVVFSSWAIAAGVGSLVGARACGRGACAVLARARGRG